MGFNLYHCLAAYCHLYLYLRSVVLWRTFHICSLLLATKDFVIIFLASNKTVFDYSISIWFLNCNIYFCIWKICMHIGLAYFMIFGSVCLPSLKCLPWWKITYFLFQVEHVPSSQFFCLFQSIWCCCFGCSIISCHNCG